MCFVAKSSVIPLPLLFTLPLLCYRVTEHIIDDGSMGHDGSMGQWVMMGQWVTMGHGSMGHGSRIRWVRWVMGHEK